MFYFGHGCHIVAVQLCTGSGAGKGWRVCPNLRVRGRIGSHLRKSWKIGVMPTFSTWPVVSYFFSWSEYALWQMPDVRSFLFTSWCIFSSIFHNFYPTFPFSQRPDDKHHQCRCLSCRVPADDQYWVFREADVLPGYPQPLREYGQGVPAHKIDTAIWWEPNGYTYLFSGDRCIF